MQQPATQRWLWVTPAVADRRSTGALVYSLSLVDAVAEHGVDMTCIGLGSDADARNDVGPTYIAVDSPVRPGWQRLATTHPNQTAATSVRSFGARIEALLRERWDVVVVDGMQTAWVASRLDSRRVGCVVHIGHNHEASMRTQIARSVPWSSLRRPLLELDALKTTRLERAVVRRADVVTSISAEDLERFRQDAPHARHVLVQPGWSAPIELRHPTPMSDRPRRVGILGSFEWHPKQEGLRRFLAVADPVFAREGIELVVAGKVPDDFRRPLEDRLMATRFLGWVDDPADVLSACRIGAIAEPLGGGFKLKALDYVFNDVAVASLTHSAAGLPFVAGSSMILGDDEASLVDAIVDAIDDSPFLERVVLEARKIAADHFSWSAAARSLLDAVNGSDPGWELGTPATIDPPVEPGDRS